MPHERLHDAVETGIYLLTPTHVGTGQAAQIPTGGYLPSGTVTGVIDDRPSCAELVARIVEEAETTLKNLANGAAG